MVGLLRCRTGKAEQRGYNHRSRPMSRSGDMTGSLSGSPQLTMPVWQVSAGAAPLRRQREEEGGEMTTRMQQWQ